MKYLRLLYFDKNSSCLALMAPRLFFRIRSTASLGESWSITIFKMILTSYFIPSSISAVATRTGALQCKVNQVVRYLYQGYRHNILQVRSTSSTKYPAIKVVSQVQRIRLKSKSWPPVQTWNQKIASGARKYNFEDFATKLRTNLLYYTYSRILYHILLYHPLYHNTTDGFRAANFGLQTCLSRRHLNLTRMQQASQGGTSGHVPHKEPPPEPHKNANMPLKEATVLHKEAPEPHKNATYLSRRHHMEAPEPHQDANVPL